MDTVCTRMTFWLLFILSYFDVFKKILRYYLPPSQALYKTKNVQSKMILKMYNQIIQSHQISIGQLHDPKKP